MAIRHYKGPLGVFDYDDTEFKLERFIEWNEDYEQEDVFCLRYIGKETDGSKIINVIFNKLFSFNLSYKLSNILSISLIIILLYISNGLMEILILMFLIIKTIDSIIKNKYIFNKFLFERYLYKINFKNNKIVSNIYSMKKDYKHLFYIDKTYKTEREILLKKFDKQG